MIPRDVMPIAVRAWTTRIVNAVKTRNPNPTRQRQYPSEVLVFDTETRDGPAQQLLIGVWRLYRDAPGTPACRTCIEEGLVYPDDLPDRDPTAWALLQTYARGNTAHVAPGFVGELVLRPLSWWLHHRLHMYGYEHADRCAVVGFNLPFDLGTVAQHWAAARGRFAGGWSLSFHGRVDEEGRWKDRPGHPRLLMRSIDPRRTLFAWAGIPKSDQPQFGDHRGEFVDLRTAAFALTDEPMTLERACTVFGDPFDKVDVEYGQLSVEMLDYARADVMHTATLYRNILDELDQHPGVDLQPGRLYSPASVGTAIVRGFGLTPPLEKFADLDPEVLGYAMSAFYGGRAEARIVRTPMPVVVLDATSMYSLVNGLLDTWSLLTAANIATRDATQEVRSLISDRQLGNRLYNPTTWQRIGVTLVQLDHPKDVRLPVRGAYQHNPATSDAATRFGIGCNPLTYDGALWFALPDVIAASLDSPLDPATISRAIRLDPVGVQDGLRPLVLHGQVLIDPRTQNPFLAMINERHRVKADLRIDKEERGRLDRFFKITASATSYGIQARFDRRENTKAAPVTVYGPGDPFTVPTRYPEDPGPFCFPPVAASITAGARLILTMIETAVTQAGGQFVFMDTDSIAIVATETGGPTPGDTGDTINAITALAISTVREIAARFAILNLYADHVRTPELGRSIWKVEHDSLTNPLWCIAIATKAYVLYRTRDGQVEIVDDVDRTEVEE